MNIAGDLFAGGFRAGDGIREDDKAALLTPAHGAAKFGPGVAA
jgi:hypothetical protein